MSAVAQSEVEGSPMLAVPWLVQLLRAAHELEGELEANPRPELVDQAIALRERMTETLEALITACEDTQTEHAEVGTSIDDLADLTFWLRVRLSRLALQDVRLRSVDPNDVTVALVARQVARSAFSLVEAIDGSGESLPAAFADRELAASLHLRQVFVDFRRALALDEPLHEDAAGRMRTAAVQISMLLEATCPAICCDQRNMLVGLQGRLNDWLEDEHRTGAEARSIWSALASATDQLQGINARRELVDHDTEALRNALLSPQDALAWAERCRGRDPELDALLDAEEPTEYDRWEGVMSDVLGRLDRGRDDDSGIVMLAMDGSGPLRL